MKDFIFDQIEIAIKPLYQANRITYWQWYDVKRTYTSKLLSKLDPQLPEDGTPQIAFNVLDAELNVLDKPRIKTRTTRFLTRKLQLNSGFLSDKTIQDIADVINKQYFGDAFEIRLDSGAKITENYRNKIGGNSCMTGDYADCTMLYEMNPDRFRQLVVKYCSDSARAIVSKLDNGKYYCNRIYATADNVYLKLLDYVKSQNWGCYDYNTPCDSKLIISGLEWQDGHVPYMDTFNYYKITDGKLDIFADDVIDCDGTTDSTDGYLENRYTCSWCEERYNLDELTTIGYEYYCEDCINEYFSRCEECEEYYHNDHISWLNDIPYCSECLDKVADTCADCGEIDYKDDMMETDDGIVCCDCKDNYFECESCNCVLKMDEHGHGNICDDCYEEES